MTPAHITLLELERRMGLVANTLNLNRQAYQVLTAMLRNDGWWLRQTLAGYVAMPPTSVRRQMDVLAAGGLLEFHRRRGARFRPSSRRLIIRLHAESWNVIVGSQPGFSSEFHKGLDRLGPIVRPNHDDLTKLRFSQLGDSLNLLKGFPLLI